MCLGRRYSAKKEETVKTLKGPSLRVKKDSVGGMLSPGSIFKKGMTFTGELIRGMLGCGWRVRKSM